MIAINPPCFNCLAYSECTCCGNACLGLSPAGAHKIKGIAMGKVLIGKRLTKRRGGRCGNPAAVAVGSRARVVMSSLCFQGLVTANAVEPKNSALRITRFSNDREPIRGT